MRLIYAECPGKARHEAATRRHEEASREAREDHRIERKT
jgi:hypothetical protein